MTRARRSSNRSRWRRRAWFSRVFGASMLLLAPLEAVAGSAVRLFIAAPCPPPTPGYCVLGSVNTGTPFTLGIDALDTDGNPDPSYIGTWSFSSTDPLATLPPSQTVTPSDQGHLVLTNAAVLRTPGTQSITVTESAGRLPPGVMSITVFPAGAQAVPATSGVVTVVLAVALAAAGACLARLKA
jgi:hypothetical protein